MYVPTISDWILTLTVLSRYCYNVGNVADLSGYLSHFTITPALTGRNDPNFGIKISQQRTIHINQNSVKTLIFWWNKKKVDEIFFPLLPPENLNWFWPWIIVQPFLPLCSWEGIAFFSEQEPPRSFLPNGAKPLRFEHEPSQNLIRICQFVIIIRYEW